MLGGLHHQEGDRNDGAIWDSSKKTRGMAQASLDLIEAMSAIAEE
jgi:hypothetical protein